MTFLGLSTGLTGLRASQRALETIGNNIANANTPGYHRQDVRLVERDPVEITGLLIGTGVEVSSIHRAYASVTEGAMSRNIAEKAAADATLTSVQQLENALAPGGGSLLDSLQSFFNELERLTAHPDSAAARQIVVNTAKELASRVRGLTGTISDQMAAIDSEIDQTIADVQGRTNEIVSLNRRIQQAELQNRQPNDLIDQRDQLINELAALIDVEVETVMSGDETTMRQDTVFRMADGMIVFGDKPPEFQSMTNADGTRTIVTGSAMTPQTITQGRLGGLLTARNDMLLGGLEAIEQFVEQMAGAIDTVHATGIGLDGSFAALAGGRSFAASDTPLATASDFLPVQNGSLFINVIDPAGARTLHEVTIDANVDSLDDVAAAISSIDNLQAFTTPATGQIHLAADTGYQFDFTGQLATRPDTSGFTGTAVASTSGVYRGSVNQTFTAELLGGGTVGVTDGLMMRVTDGGGSVVATLNVGLGYEVGTELQIGDGLTVGLSSGTVSAGDQFTFTAVASPDTTGFLAAAGLNTLFVGDRAEALEVSSLVADNPNRLAASQSGAELETRRAEEMLALRDARLLNNGRDTLLDAFAAILGQAGTTSEQLQQYRDNLDVVGETLQAEIAGFSGVDPNEEALRMLQFQRSFQAAARYITTIDEVLAELMGIIR